MAAIDINRSTTGVYLQPEVSGEIWQAAQESSAIMAVADEIPMAGPGEAVDLITGDPTATWQGETEEANVSRPTFGSKVITPYTVSVIVPMSKKFARDKKKLADEAIKRLPRVLARKFDTTVMGPDAGKPGSNFDTLAAAAAVGISGNVWGGLVAADGAISVGDGLVDGWLLSPQARSILLGKVDGNGRPLFVDSIASGQVPMVLGNPARISKHVYLAGTPNQVGFAGDWETAHFGIVEGIELDIAREATINDGGEQVNLWQRGMIAVKAEFEIGFRIEDIARFARLTDATQA